MAAAPPTTHAPPLSVSWHLGSGAVSGIASVLALQPLDRESPPLRASPTQLTFPTSVIKTRVQQDHSLERQPAASTSRVAVGSGGQAVLLATESTAPRPRAKIWTTAKQVVRSDGFVGLWRGTTPTLYRNVPGVSLYFLTLSRLRAAMGTSGYFVAKGGAVVSGSGARKVKLTTAGDLIVGSTARTGVGFILMPFTLLKTLSESTLAIPKGTSSFGAMRALYATGGLKSLWRGAVPTALRDAPGAGLFIVFYERGRRILGVRGDAGGGAVGGGMAGASASLLSTLLTTPFDLIKTRRQLSPTLYTSMGQSIALVYNTGGIRGFWEGGGLRVVRKAGSAGIGWAVYEAVLSLGEKRRAGTKSKDGEDAR
ncbi:hypothetical protein P7C70_g4118, partial [Phenoliferia sp. Uapishka_3]